LPRQQRQGPLVLGVADELKQPAAQAGFGFVLELGDQVSDVLTRAGPQHREAILLRLGIMTAHQPHRLTETLPHGQKVPPGCMSGA